MYAHLSAYSNSCFNLAIDMAHGSMGDTVSQNGPYNMFQIIINITRPEQETMWQELIDMTIIHQRHK